MDLRERLRALARMKSEASPVVSVYLNTRWADEHQRERVRVFVQREVQAARDRYGAALAADLGWIDEQTRALIAQSRVPEADGVALFACAPLGLRETLPVRVSFADAFVVAESPHVRPLVAAADDAPSALVVFVDSESARLVPLGPEGAGDEVRLATEVPGRHRRGGWAQLAQSRYQRHIQDHRARHFEAVAEAVREIAEGRLERIVIAADPRNGAELRKHLPSWLVGRVAGTIPASRHEAAAALLERAGAILTEVERREEVGAVDDLLTEAAKGGRAVAGLAGTLDAVARGAVHRLHLLGTFAEAGGWCDACGSGQAGSEATCRRCGTRTRPVELGATLIERVITAGGQVETVEHHDGLARVGGVAARLRYPL